MGVDTFEQTPPFLSSTDFIDYTVVDHLGMETEHLVWHPPGAQYATLTVAHSSSEADEAHLDAFREALDAVAGLAHPSLVPVLDWGIHRDLPYVITPYYPGGTLLQYLHIAGPLPLAEIVARLTPVAEALDEAHRHDIVHYMLTPNAILRTADDRSVLAHLGLGRWMLETSHIPEVFLPYAAPEIYLRMPCTAAVDVYALGVIIFQMLMGDLPFDGVTHAQQMSGHVNHPVPSLRRLRPDLPPGVQHVLDRALDKLPQVRYPTAGALLSALAQAAGLGSDRQPLIRTPISRETMGGRYSYSSDEAKPGKLRRKIKGGYVSLSKLFVDALMIEHHNPVEAAAIYRQIVQIEPQYSNGAIVERLARLELELDARQAPDLLAEAQAALEARDWVRAEQAARHLLSIDPLDHTAQRIQRKAASGAAASEHYRMARLAMECGERQAAVLLLRELAGHDPQYDDPDELRVVTREVAGYVREAHAIRAHDERILALAFSPDNRHLVTGATDKRVRLWRLADLALVYNSELQPAWVCGAAFTPDGAQLLSATWDGEIRLWDVPQMAYAGIIAGLVNQVQALAFAVHDPTLMATSSAQWLTLWTVPGGLRRATLYEEDRSPVMALAFSPTAPRLVCGLANGDIRVRDVALPGFPVSLNVAAHSAPIYDVAVSPDGALAAAAARDGTVSVIDLRDGSLAARLNGHTSSARGVAFSPDGSLLATCSRDRTVRLWDPASGQTLQVLEGHQRGVRRVSFSPDGRTLASADSGGIVRLWQL